MAEHTTGHIIKRIEFGVLRPEEAKGLSVAPIDTKTLYDVDTRRPIASGPLDLRLGVSTKAGTCQTCGDALLNCPGHFGYIRLALPVYHIGLLKHTITVLNCICKTCGSLLVSQARRLSLRTAPGLINTEAVKAECKKARACPSCHSPNGTVKKSTAFRIYHELKTPKETVSTEINPQACLNIFGMVREEDLPYLGLKASPTAFVLETLLVPPSCIRPSVDMNEEGFNEDDLTVKFSEIINASNMLRESIQRGNSLQIINDDWDMLQLHVSLLINSDLPSVSVPGAAPIRGLVQRMKGKAGRFRCNLSGKRVDFSGRTVISPDPNLSVEEVGIPEQVAKILTVPERVTDFNKGRLSRLVANGLEYPGANYVLSRDGNGREFKRFLMYGRGTELRTGDTVERHLLDGDVLLFNRQPSLHRMSIMAHRVRVHKHRTFRFNESVCAPYNADYDGDEMNIHLPQTLESHVEAGVLMAVRNNMCTPRNGEPLVACTQDFVTGAFLLTGRDALFTRARFAQLCSYVARSAPFRIAVRPAIVAPVELFTGKQLFEVIIRHSLAFAGAGHALISLDARNRSFKGREHPNDGHVLVLANRVLKGRIDKAIIGGENRKNSLIYQLMRASKGAAVEALNSISRVSTRYLAERGFSIGFDDVHPSPELIAEKTRLVRERYAQATAEIASGGAAAETRVAGILSQIREECGTVCIQTLGKRNSTIVMQECGSKGSKINVSQMIACVGQQMVSGHRILDEMGNRTLPHFVPRCMSPESKGFVMNSFFSGLASYEFFFHAASGRVGLVDTAVKTAETGYMQRRLMKALEDLSVKYDFTVRNSFNDLIQIQYGDDSVEPLNDLGSEFFEWVFLESKVLFDIACNNGIARINNGIARVDNDASVADAIINSISAGTPLMSENLKKFIEEKKDVCFFNNGIFYAYFGDENFVEIFRGVINRILDGMRIDPATAVGAIAGQSIGEPTTQMTLETFHFAGVASANITLGVPRIKEIINASANISTPNMTIQLCAPNRESAMLVRARLECLLLREVCPRVTVSTGPDGLSITFFIDTELMRRLQLEVTLPGISATINASLKDGCVEVGDGATLKYSVKRIRESSVFSIERMRRQILETRIAGIQAARRVLVNQKSDDSYELILQGTGLLQVLGTAGVDPYRSVTNDIMEALRVLGIEAARALIVSEIERTMGGHGIRIDHRHVMLLGDTMCFRGAVLGITRFGISKMRASTLMLASFEQTADYLFNAAAYGVLEPISGISESIIMGRQVSLGSGAPLLLWDEERYQQILRGMAVDKL